MKFLWSLVLGIWGFSSHTPRLMKKNSLRPYSSILVDGLDRAHANKKIGDAELQAIESHLAAMN